MPDQIKYYNHFGEKFEEGILTAPEPEYWTTDYYSEGKIYREMKNRVDRQKEIILHHFNLDKPILDIGCGFGRQAFFLAKRGFFVTGIDTSPVFIKIAAELFKKNGLKGIFFEADILQNHPLAEKYYQVILLDVIEHIPPGKRKKFFNEIANLTGDNARIVVSIPHVKKRLSSQINNRVRRSITQYFSYFRNKEEHPFPIPQKKDLFRIVSDNFEIEEYNTFDITDFAVIRKKSLQSNSH